MRRSARSGWPNDLLLLLNLSITSFSLPQTMVLHLTIPTARNKHLCLYFAPVSDCIMTYISSAVSSSVIFITCLFHRDLSPNPLDCAVVLLPFTHCGFVHVPTCRILLSSMCRYSCSFYNTLYETIQNIYKIIISKASTRSRYSFSV